MPKQLVYQGCDKQFSARVTWESQNMELPNTYKTDFTPIKVYIAEPEQGGELNRYNYYEFFYRWRIRDYHVPEGTPISYWRETDNEGNPLVYNFYVYGAPSAPYKRFERIDNNGYPRELWCVLVKGVYQRQVYDEVTGEVTVVDEFTEEEISFLQSGRADLPNGDYYGETQVLESWVIDENGNRINLGGGIGESAWRLIVEGLVGETYEEVFKLSFLAQPRGITVDCDQCPNGCLKITSDDKKRFACVCREEQ